MNLTRYCMNNEIHQAYNQAHLGSVNYGINMMRLHRTCRLCLVSTDFYTLLTEFRPQQTHIQIVFLFCMTFTVVIQKWNNLCWFEIALFPKLKRTLFHHTDEWLCGWNDGRWCLSKQRETEMKKEWSSLSEQTR